MFSLKVKLFGPLFWVLIAWKISRSAAYGIFFKGNVWRALIRFNAEIVSTGANEDLLEFIERIHGEYDDSTDENI